jgi:hypothetical protein
LEGVDDADAFERDLELSRGFLDLGAITQEDWDAEPQ